MNKYYAGIGSRETPVDVLEYMRDTAMRLHAAGYILRSGGAEGADTAFESGSGGSREIFRSRNCTPEAEVMAASYHPNWPACRMGARMLHGRNCMIVLGKDVLEPVPVDFIICWTQRGAVVGGTGQALRMANALDIEVFNLGIEDPGKLAVVKQRIDELSAAT